MRECINAFWMYVYKSISGWERSFVRSISIIINTTASEGQGKDKVGKGFKRIFNNGWMGKKISCLELKCLETLE